MKLYITTTPAHFVRLVTRAQRIKFDALAAGDSGREKAKTRVKSDALAAGDSGREVKSKNKTKTRVKFDALAAGRFRHHVVTAEGKNKKQNNQNNNKKRAGVTKRGGNAVPTERFTRCAIYMSLLVSNVAQSRVTCRLLG